MKNKLINEGDMLSGQDMAKADKKKVKKSRPEAKFKLSVGKKGLPNPAYFSFTTKDKMEHFIDNFSNQLFDTYNKAYFESIEFKRL